MIMHHTAIYLLPLGGSVAVSFCSSSCSHHFPKSCEMWHVDDSYFADGGNFNERWRNLTKAKSSGGEDVLSGLSHFDPQSS